MNVQSIPDLRELRVGGLLSMLVPVIKALEKHGRATPENAWIQFEQFKRSQQHLYCAAEFIELENRMIEQFPWIDE